MEIAEASRKLAIYSELDLHTHAHHDHDKLFISSLEWSIIRSTIIELLTPAAVISSAGLRYEGNRRVRIR